MCVAILKTPNNPLSDAVLKACFEGNTHGAGFAYIEDGKVIVEKGWFDFDEFLKAYRVVEERVQANGPMLVHFRISTGTPKTVENCHPFLFKHGAFIHNGWFFSAPGEKSDTNMLVEKIGDRLTKTALRANKEAVEKSFGKNNKCAVLYPDGDYVIINEDEGAWVGGNWFSNTFWQWRAGGGGTARRADGLRIPQSATGLTDEHYGGHGFYGHGWGMDD